MEMQQDLFAVADVHTHEPAEPEVQAADALPIAVPCGFRDRGNRACQRLASTPVMIEGHAMKCRGRPMLHCDPACYGAIAPAAPPEPDEGRIAEQDMAWANYDPSSDLVPVDPYEED